MGLGDKAAALALSERAMTENPIQKDVVRVACSRCVMRWDTEPEPEEEAQRYDNGCQFLNMSEGGRRTLRDYIPPPQRRVAMLPG
jgi:hypothetical protein